MIRDAHLAEDVTQGVFLALSRSAAQLTAHPVLSGWLHRTTRNLAANAIRSDVRRRAHEQDAAVMNDRHSTSPDAAWEDISPLLDAALGALSAVDRDVLLLRYFERKSAREMAQTLGTSQEAAQKRVNRAIVRLRDLLAKRGVAAGASGLAALLGANAVQAAPAGLTLSVTTTVTLAGPVAAALTTSTVLKTLTMTTLQKAIIASTLAIAIGVGIYQTRRVAILRAQIMTLEAQTHASGASANAAPAILQSQVDALEAKTTGRAAALSEANADKAKLINERDQARHSASLYKELADQTAAEGANPTNAYPTPRHVWAAFGKFGRLSALSKEDDSHASPEEKSALEAAKIKALEELPSLIKAAKQYDAAKSSQTDMRWDDLVDEVSCLLYGALNLDEQQFAQVYSVMERIAQAAKEKKLSKDSTGPEGLAALNQIMDQFKAETQTVLTAEQSRIFLRVVDHLQVEPGKFGFNFNF